MKTLRKWADSRKDNGHCEEELRQLYDKLDAETRANTYSNPTNHVESHLCIRSIPRPPVIVFCVSDGYIPLCTTVQVASMHRAPARRALARCQESDYCTTFSGNNAIVMITL